MARLMLTTITIIRTSGNACNDNTGNKNINHNNTMDAGKKAPALCQQADQTHSDTNHKPPHALLAWWTAREKVVSNVGYLL